MKFVLIFILGFAAFNAHHYEAPVARPHRGYRGYRPMGPPPSVRVIERFYPNQNEVLP